MPASKTIILYLQINYREQDGNFNRDQYIVMIKLIRKLVTLPLRLLLLLCRYFSVPGQYMLAKWIWKIGREVEDGCRLISSTGHRDGIQAVRVLAGQILTETRSAKIAVTIGFVERQYDPDCIAIKGWIDRAEELDCNDRQLLLILKFICSSHFQEYDIKQIIEEMLACKYLPMEYTWTALVEKGDILLSEKRWEEAEEIADHLLSVKEDPSARIIKWVLSLQRGDQRQAKNHLAKSQGNLPDPVYFSQVGQGYLYLGRDSEAMEWLYKAVKGGMQWRMEKESLIGHILQSEKFASYCRERA